MLTDNRGHLTQETVFLGTKCWVGRHRGGEVMHLPVHRNCQMQRIGCTVNEHHPVFTGHAVGSARIEILDRQRITTGQGRSGYGQGIRRLYTDKMLPGVIARCA